ncbi:MAG: VWA domain-containing protein, partial [Hyphomicrobiales bacterium]|nr:VWA domain-containing protein [Hyphomicrobiales bacterium]
VPRFASLARGAAVVVLSDGLERGDPGAMRDAVDHLSRLAWRTVWLTPLAADAGFEARTAGLVAARPFLDRLGDGGSLASICDHVLDLAREKAA